MVAKGRRLRPNPVQQTAEPRTRIERFARGAGGVACLKIPRMERLRRRYRITFHQGRTPDANHDLLDHLVDWPVIPDLLRFRECRSAELDQGGSEEMGRLVRR